MSSIHEQSFLKDILEAIQLTATQVTKKGHMERRLVAIHLVCRGGRGIRWVDKETFTTGGWVISPEHIHDDVVVALHESKVQDSYLQGKVLQIHSINETLTDSGRRQRRLELLVKQTATPLAWQGQGSGEKGLVWNE